MTAMLDRGNAMNNENDSPEDVEKRLQNYFQKKAEDLKAPSNLWAKLESRLDEAKKKPSPDKQTKRENIWFAGPRLIGVAASVAAVLLLLVSGLVWLTGDNGGNSPADQEIALSPSSGEYGDDVTVSGGGFVPTLPQGLSGPAGAADYEDANGELTQGIPKGVPPPVPAPTPNINGSIVDDSYWNYQSGESFSSAAGDTGASGLSGNSGNALNIAQRQVISTA